MPCRNARPWRPGGVLGWEKALPCRRVDLSHLGQQNARPGDRGGDGSWLAAGNGSRQPVHDRLVRRTNGRTTTSSRATGSSSSVAWQMGQAAISDSMPTPGHQLFQAFQPGAALTTEGDCIGFAETETIDYGMGAMAPLRRVHRRGRPSPCRSRRSSCSESGRSLSSPSMSLPAARGRWQHVEGRGVNVMWWPGAQIQRGHGLCGDESDWTSHHAHSG